MKRTTIIALSLPLIMSALTFSCENLANALGLTSKPELKTESVGIDSLDMEKMTFNCDYSISNPYPVAFSVAGITANVVYNGTDEIENPPSFTVKTADGLTVNANSTSQNEMDFEVPYNTILQLVHVVQSLSEKTSLPFALKGDITLDLSSITNETLGTVLDTLTNDRQLVIPFEKSFDVPVFKPSFSVSDVNIKYPTSDEMISALVKGGMNLITAGALFASEGFSENLLKQVDIPVSMNFNLNVANEGSAPWKFALKDCSLKDSTNFNLADVTPTNEASTIDSASGTIPMSATLRTTTAAAYIVQLIKGTAENPNFVLDSGISFTQLEQYGLNLPLKYSYELPVK